MGETEQFISQDHFSDNDRFYADQFRREKIRYATSFRLRYTFYANYRRLFAYNVSAKCKTKSSGLSQAIMVYACSSFAFSTYTSLFCFFIQRYRGNDRYQKYNFTNFLRHRDAFKCRGGSIFRERNSNYGGHKRFSWEISNYRVQFRLIAWYFYGGS